jgi:hypothetical protein
VQANGLPAASGARIVGRMSAIRTTIAGIPIPDSMLARGATELVQDASTQLLFDHSRRVFLSASLQGEKLGLHFDDLSAAQRDAVLAAHPRTNFKKGIVEAFAAGMRDKPETTFGTMNTDVLEATVPGYVRPNFCDYIQNARFGT